MQKYEKKRTGDKTDLKIAGGTVIIKNGYFLGQKIAMLFADLKNYLLLSHQNNGVP